MSGAASSDDRATARPAPEGLFVYGSLCPGGSNEHVLAPLQGTFEPGAARGRLLQLGWGAAMGYPAIVLDPEGDRVPGYLFRSERLPMAWPELDAFEGEQYLRTATDVELESGRRAAAFIYALRREDPPTDPDGAGGLSPIPQG